MDAPWKPLSLLRWYCHEYYVIRAISTITHSVIHNLIIAAIKYHHKSN